MKPQGCALRTGTCRHWPCPVVPDVGCVYLACALTHLWFALRVCTACFGGTASLLTQTEQPSAQKSPSQGPAVLRAKCQPQSARRKQTPSVPPPPRTRRSPAPGGAWPSSPQGPVRARSGRVSGHRHRQAAHSRCSVTLTVTRMPLQTRSQLCGRGVPPGVDYVRTPVRARDYG